MIRCKTVVILFVNAALFVRATLAEPPPEEVLLSLEDTAAIQLRLSGREQLSCHTRWHNVDLECALSCEVPVTVADLAAFLPDEGVSIGDQWQVPPEFVSRFGKQIFVRLQRKPKNPAAYNKWLGDMPRTKKPPPVVS